MPSSIFGSPTLVDLTSTLQGVPPGPAGPPLLLRQSPWATTLSPPRASVPSRAELDRPPDFAGHACSTSPAALRVQGAPVSRLADSLSRLPATPLVSPQLRSLARSVEGGSPPPPCGSHSSGVSADSPPLEADVTCCRQVLIDATTATAEIQSIRVEGVSGLRPSITDVCDTAHAGLESGAGP